MLGRREIRIKVMQYIYSHKISKSNNILETKNNLYESIEKIYDLYIYLLNIIIIQRDIEKNKIELRKNKNNPTINDINPNLKFINNKILSILSNNTEIHDYININSKLAIDIYDIIPNKIYKNIYSSEEYKKYMSDSHISFQKDLNFILDIFDKYIISFKILKEQIEDIELSWIYDIYIARDMIIHTLKSFTKKSDKNISLFKIYKDKSNKKFTEDLFIHTINNQDNIKQIIFKKSRNWDINRIATIDYIIISMGIAEIIYMKNIPKKVTINEYIEISKYFSTHKSYIFINGILNAISKDIKKHYI